MSVSGRDVEGIAELAALYVDDAALPELTAQIARIIEYVSQLEATVETPESATGYFWVGHHVPQGLRPDRVEQPDLQRGLETMAPAFKDGFFVVPRLTAMEDE